MTHARKTEDPCPIDTSAHEAHLSNDGQSHDDAQPLRQQTLLALLEASRAMATELKVAGVLERIAQQAAIVFQCQGASVLLYDQPRHELVFVAATGPQAAKLKSVRFDASLGIAGHALRTGHAVRVNDVQENDHFFDGIDERTSLCTRSLMACPLIHGSQTLGVIEVLNPLHREAFSQDDLPLLEIFANMAAVAASNARSFEELDHHNAALRQAQQAGHMVGSSPAMQAVMELCATVAPTNTTVLLTGETGTGKEMAARHLHALSKRRHKPFVAINCAAVAESLLESELFGHEKGAFTGAAARRLGRFELASGGTLLLDEVGEMSPNLQVKFLRVLQERCFERVGGSQTISTDVRIIAATNRDLRARTASGEFREDLFYRLAVFPIHLPPLRQRLDDLPALIDAMLIELAPSLGLSKPSITPEAVRAMQQYHWPGNVRELRNVVERSALLGGGCITPQRLPAEIQSPDQDNHNLLHDNPATDTPAPAQLLHATAAVAGSGRLVDQERALLLEALMEHDWNQSAAARALGISRDVLRYRIKKHQLQKP